MHVPASGLEGPWKRAAVSTACLLGILLFIPFLFVSYLGTGGNGEHLQERRGPSNLDHPTPQTISALNGDLGIFFKKMSPFGCQG